MRVDRKELHTAVGRVIPAADKQGQVEGYDTVLFAPDGQIKTFSSLMQITHPCGVKLKGKPCVRVYELHKLLGTLTTDVVELTEQKTFLQVKAGTTVAKMPYKKSEGLLQLRLLSLLGL